MSSQSTITPGTHKVRRSSLGSKRASGHSIQGHHRARRADPKKIHTGTPDRSLTGYGGLIDFARFTQSIGLEREFARVFGELKLGPWVVYTMPFMLRLLVDVFIAGGTRLFDLEHFAADPVFQRLAGGFVPSIDVAYTDLRRLDSDNVASLESLMSAQAIAVAKTGKWNRVHLDIDPTVLPVSAEVGGAAVGYNPQYHGRPSYHPLIARIAEADVVIAAQLRPGNTTFGDADAAFVRHAIELTRQGIKENATLCVRIDKAGDCAEVMRAVHKTGAYYLTKAKMSADLALAIQGTAPNAWKTVERDADGSAEVQVAEIDFRRGTWGEGDERLPIRVIAVRRTDRVRRSCSFLWPDMDWIIDVYLATDPLSEPFELAAEYEGRAGIEPLIGECKSGWDIAALGMNSFEANHAVLLLKLLSLNLLRRYAAAAAPAQKRWRTCWLRRLLIEIPGRFVRSGRRTTIRLGRRSHTVALN